MLSHPWTELQLLIKEKWLTQKAFSAILWKKVSELNELLKWKRNITIQRDYLLHQTLWTPIKYWILKQVDYDYSLIDIDEENSNNNPGSVSMTDQDRNREQNENVVEPGLNWEKNTHTQDSSSLYSSEWQINTQETPAQEQKNENDEDLKNRVQIFRNF